MTLHFIIGEHTTNVDSQTYSVEQSSVVSDFPRLLMVDVCQATVKMEPVSSRCAWIDGVQMFPATKKRNELAFLRVADDFPSFCHRSAMNSDFFESLDTA